MNNSTTPPTAAAMVVPGLNRKCQINPVSLTKNVKLQKTWADKLQQTLLNSWTCSPSRVINGAASLVHFKAAWIKIHSISGFKLHCLWESDCLYSRYSAVSVAGQTVSCGVAVFPHSLTILQPTTGTAIHTQLSILIILTLHAIFCTLKREK